MTLGIVRSSHIGLHVEDPSAAAAYATEKLGFRSAGSDQQGRHYVKAHGPDPYSVVYVPGQGGIEHVSFLVPDESALSNAEAYLHDNGVEILESASDSDEKDHGPYLRFEAPDNIVAELTVGPQVSLPVPSFAPAPESVPGPISLDHFGLCSADVPAARRFWTEVAGLKLSATVADLVAFTRPAVYYLCVALFFSQRREGLNHFAVSLKDRTAFLEAVDSFESSGAEIVWGPGRHGPGHNLFCYVRDSGGNIIEYLAEEEIVLDDESYRPRAWSPEDVSAFSEWGNMPPEDFL